MAKIIDQSIPPELQTLWATLHSPAKKTQGASGTVKATNFIKKPKKKPRRNLDLIALKNIAILVADIAFTKKGNQIPPDFVFNMTQDLQLGVIDGEFFRPCTLDYLQTLESIPTYSADLDPPPYGWRTELNAPSVPVYPNGSIVSGGPLYSGQKIGTIFADTVLRWRRKVFKSDLVDETNGDLKVVMRWNSQINIATSARGSRPMVSMNLRACLSTDTDSVLSSKEPPIMERTVFYWRFKVPPSAAPYYSSYQVRREVKALSRILKKSGTGLFTRYVLDACNRPMMGRGYNNNNTVDTSLSGDPELFEIRHCPASDHSGWSVIPYSSTQEPRDIAYSPLLNLYVACAWGNMLMSTDLYAWSANWAGGTTILSGVVWSPKLALFVACGSGGGPAIFLRSSNGSAWTISPVAIAFEPLSICWSDALGIFVACGYGGAGVGALWSENGIDWYAAAGAPIGVWRGVAWSDRLGLFVAAGSGGDNLYSMWSEDGKTWTPVYHTSSVGFYAVAWSPELSLFVMTTDYWPGNVSATSSDGKSWSISETGFANSYSGVAWCPPLHAFVASGGNSGAANMLISSDGSAWAPFATGNTKNFTHVRWFDETCTLIAVSPDYNQTHFMKTINP